LWRSASAFQLLCVALSNTMSLAGLAAGTSGGFQARWWRSARAVQLLRLMYTAVCCLQERVVGARQDCGDPQASSWRVARTWRQQGCAAAGHCPGQLLQVWQCCWRCETVLFKHVSRATLLGNTHQLVLVLARAWSLLPCCCWVLAAYCTFMQTTACAAAARVMSTQT
jgi:hypothetical protein